ncbi:hypothetical protein [Pseudomonas sp. CC120222-01a]|uniref:hypothetical protein n=1 Tax=Pseudomonas sp. CC120222-01a TaxID=1378075 RepID=UPI000D98A745|nr:hypothetical protein [Pseudomonas sp. CC120222-01a]PVZ39334.1 hypothetical protein N430_03885 [Pseudomonas sp. CC120222-01a]
MNGSKQDFLRYLDDCRKKVEQWPTWKQEALKAPGRQRSQADEGCQARAQSKR